MIENETKEEIKQDAENREGGGRGGGETTTGRGGGGGGRGGRGGRGEGEERRSLDDVWRKKLKAKEEDEGRKENGVRGRGRRGREEEGARKERVREEAKDVVRSSERWGRGKDAKTDAKSDAKTDADEGLQRQNPGEDVDNKAVGNYGAVKNIDDDADDGDVAKTTTTTTQKGAGKKIDGGKTTPESKSRFTDIHDRRKGSGNRYEVLFLSVGCTPKFLTLNDN